MAETSPDLGPITPPAVYGPPSAVTTHYARAIAEPERPFGVAPWRVTDVYAITPGVFACLRDGNGFIVAQMPWPQAQYLCELLNAQAHGQH